MDTHIETVDDTLTIVEPETGSPLKVDPELFRHLVRMAALGATVGASASLVSDRRPATEHSPDESADLTP